jgi:hypothetical protein
MLAAPREPLLEFFQDDSPRSTPTKQVVPTAQTSQNSFFDSFTAPVTAPIVPPTKQGKKIYF